LRGYFVTAVATLQEPRYATDRRHTDTGEAVNLAIGKLTLQVFDDAPPVRHGLNLGRGAQVAQESTAFLGLLQGCEGGVQVALGERFLAGSDVAVAFDGVPMY